LISCVLPGVEEIRARPLRLQIAFIRDDLPTLDLPIKAYSGRSCLGHWDSCSKLPTNSISLIIIPD